MVLPLFPLAKEIGLLYILITPAKTVAVIVHLLKILSSGKWFSSTCLGLYKTLKIVFVFSFI